jgi:hypothetical protein
MSKYKEQIEKAIAEGYQIQLNPKAMQKLKDAGVAVPEFRIIPWQEYIEGFFSDKRKNEALQRVQKLPELPDLPLPEVTKIYKEILTCITFGLNRAAITLSCILVEYMLKYASFKIEMGGFGKYDATKWEELKIWIWQEQLVERQKTDFYPKKKKDH